MYYNLLSCRQFRFASLAIPSLWYLLFFAHSIIAWDLNQFCSEIVTMTKQRKTTATEDIHRRIRVGERIRHVICFSTIPELAIHDLMIRFAKSLGL
jgi:hypothetical protein